jgi:predicted acylesterase/phospholipase RssA
MSDNINIKHLVLSGGNIWGFSMLGIIIEALKTNFIDIENIDTIWATSVGSIVGLITSLKIESKLVEDYFVKRPWQDVCKNNKVSVLDIFDEKGLIHRGFFDNLLSPLLSLVELSTETTMLELYNYNNIEIHIFTTELNKYELIDISYKTHPDWSIINAIYASCCIPVLFSPLIIGDKCYIDGGFILNYPIEKGKFENPNEVFGISLGNFSENNSETPITSLSNMNELMFSLLMNIVRSHSIFENDNSQPYPYQIILKDVIDIKYFIEVVYNKNERELLLNNGSDIFKNHYERWFSQ